MRIVELVIVGLRAPRRRADYQEQGDRPDKGNRCLNREESPFIFAPSVHFVFGPRYALVEIRPLTRNAKYH
jgi:hypothetical protein